MSKVLKNWSNPKTQLYLESSRKFYWDLNQLNNLLITIGIKNFKNILDIGTGLGYFAFYLRSVAHSSANIFGVDIDSNLIDKAKSIAVNQNIDIDFSEGNACKLPFSNEQFDFISEQLVLLHLSNPLTAINEIYRCLKPNGYAILIEPNNTAVTLIDDTAKRELTRSEIVDITNLELAYNRGKNISGRGDSNIGDLLPSHLLKSSFKIKTIKLVDRVNYITSPYDKDQSEIFDTLYGKNSYNQWKSLYKEYCYAAGMSSYEFKTCWNVLQKLQKIRFKQFKLGIYAGLDTKVDYLYVIQK